MKGRWTYWLMMAAVGALLVACASIGSPEGGPRDYTPPQVVKTSPEPGTVNFKGNKVEIVFSLAGEVSLTVYVRVIGVVMGLPLLSVS